jgi:hypothetical protein
MFLPPSLPAIGAALEIGQTADLRGYVFEGSYLRGNTWTELDAPAGGETAAGSNFRAPYGDETATYFEVPVTCWGDYVGSDIERSNHRSLRRDYPETFVDATAYPGAHTLMVPVASLAALIDVDDDGEIDDDAAQDLVNIFTGLRDEYPLYDEEDSSALVTELADEAWDAYAAWDLRRDLRDAIGEIIAARYYTGPGYGADFMGDAADVVDEISDADLRERFYAAVWESDEYPYAESADSVVFPMWDDVVNRLAEHYAAGSSVVAE